MIYRTGTYYMYLPITNKNLIDNKLSKEFMMKLRIFQVNTSKTYICDKGKSFWECMFLSYVVKCTGQGNTGILVRIYSQVKVHHKHKTQSDWGTVNKEGLGHLDEFNVSFSCRIHKVNLQFKKKK